MDWLHEVLGNGLSSSDVCGAVFGAFAMAGGDVFKAICMGASMGGDTDTIAAVSYTHLFTDSTICFISLIHLSLPGEKCTGAMR